MITAKNYAAQAEKALYGMNDLAFKNYSLVNIKKDLSQSVHFVMPDGGKIFNDGLKGIIYNNPDLIKLPFQKITLEFMNEGHKFLLLFKQEEDGMISHILMMQSPNELWAVVPLLLTSYLEKNSSGKIAQRLKSTTIVHGVPEEASIKLHGMMQSGIVYLFELLEALSCTNVEISTHQPASQKNEQRIKSHKLPIYETKVLTIKAGKKESSGIVAGIKCSHASPRQHLRRGHVRRIESGNIWVNSCVVGNKENGVIDKQYKVQS